MSLETKLFAISMALIFLAMLLFLAFSWTTVRKLKKNPLTRDALGFEFVSGWNIINIAQTLSLPLFIARKLNNSPASFLHANTDLLRKHTSNFDKHLARVFYYTYLSGGLSILLLAILSNFNVFA